MKKYLFILLLLVVNNLQAQRIDIRRGGLGTNILSGIYTTPSSFNSNQFTATTNVVSIKSGWLATNTINYGYVQIPTTSPEPAVSGAGTIRYYFDGTVIKASANGGAYTTLGVAGSDTQVQFNYLGFPGADSGLTYNITNHLLTVVSNISVGGITNTSIYVGTGAFTNTGIASFGGSISAVVGITNTGVTRLSGGLTTLSAITNSSDYYTTDGNKIYLGTTRSRIDSTGDGLIRLTANSGTGFTGILFGGTDNSQPFLGITGAGFTILGGDRIGSSSNNFFIPGSLSVTNGITNSTLTASRLVLSDPNKKLISATGGITNILTGNLVTNVGSITPSTSISFTFSITGATTNDLVNVTPDATVNAGANFDAMMVKGYISAADTVTIVLRNTISAVTSIDPPSGNYSVAVLQK